MPVLSYPLDGRNVHRRNSRREDGGRFNRENFIVSIMKGSTGFGFTVVDTEEGQKVNTVVDRLRCASLHEGDTLLSINGIGVENMSHYRVIEMLRDCAPHTTGVFVVARSVEDVKDNVRSFNSSITPTGDIWHDWHNSKKPSTYDSKNIDTLQQSESNRLLLTTTAPMIDTSNHDNNTPSPRTDDSSKDLAAGSSEEGSPRKSTSRSPISKLARAFRGSRSSVIVVPQSTTSETTVLRSVPTSLFSGTPDFMPASVYRQPRLSHDMIPFLESLVKNPEPDAPTTPSYVVNDDVFDASRPLTSSSPYVRCFSDPDMHRRSDVILPKLSFTDQNNNYHHIPGNTERYYQYEDGRFQNGYSNDKVIRQRLSVRCDDIIRTSGRFHSRHSTADDQYYSRQQTLGLHSPANERTFEVCLQRGRRGFGFSVRGGREFNMPLYILNVASNSAAGANSLIQGGDQILEINGCNAGHMTHVEATDRIQRSVDSIRLLLTRNSAQVKLGSLKQTTMFPDSEIDASLRLQQSDYGYGESQL